MIVVSNTSPLTNLAAVGRFELLRDLYHEVHIAEGVWQELNAGGRPHPGSQEVASSEWVQRHTVQDRELVTALLRDLDYGEAETIAVQEQLRAAWRRLRKLQSQEALAFRAAFEASLAEPVDPGKQILAEAGALRRQLEELTFANPAA